MDVSLKESCEDLMVVLFLVLVLAFSIYELWLAASRQEMHGRSGGLVVRKKNPFIFWMFVTIHSSVLVVFSYAIISWAIYIVRR